MGYSTEGLSSLADQGLANINDTVQSFQTRVNKLESTAKNIDELYSSINLRFSGENDSQISSAFSYYLFANDFCKGSLKMLAIILELHLRLISSL
jgi:hypothetical protein